jgi:sphinganine-1-phosphate aldolase
MNEEGLRSKVCFVTCDLLKTPIQQEGDDVGLVDKQSAASPVLDWLRRLSANPTSSPIRGTMTLPKTGRDKDSILRELQERKKNDVDWQSGKVWGYVYDPGKEVMEVGKQAYMMYLTENALDPASFPSLLQFENDIIGLVSKQLNGDSEVVGNFTSGGTESIICAVKAARDWARETKPHIKNPKMLLPTTAHAAFQKAAHYLGVTAVLVDVNNKTFAADPQKMEAAIDEDTIMLVGSAPSYAHGTIDPIEQLGDIAQRRGLWLHTDGCVGGWLLPYFRKLGVEMPLYDFRVPGVSSISVDLHKYAFCPKGASTVLYRNKSLRKHQIFTCTTWTGYSIVNPTVQSSKSGGPLAAAWAVINFVGDEGYMNLAKRAHEATQTIVKGIEAIKGLHLLAPPHMNLIAFGSDEVNVFHLSDLMKERGWTLQPQLAYGGSKENLHLSINPASDAQLKPFLKDLAECVEAARSYQVSELPAMAKEALSAIDPKMLTPEMLEQILSMGGMGGFELPKQMAEINETLNGLSPELRKKLLTEFLNALFKPSHA